MFSWITLKKISFFSLFLHCLSFFDAQCLFSLAPQRILLSHREKIFGKLSDFLIRDSVFEDRTSFRSSDQTDGSESLISKIQFILKNRKFSPILEGEPLQSQKVLSGQAEENSFRMSFEGLLALPDHSKARDVDQAVNNLSKENIQDRCVVFGQKFFEFVNAQGVRFLLFDRQKRTSQGHFDKNTTLQYAQLYTDAKKRNRSFFLLNSDSDDILFIKLEREESLETFLIDCVFEDIGSLQTQQLSENKIDALAGQLFFLKVMDQSDQRIETCWNILEISQRNSHETFQKIKNEWNLSREEIEKFQAIGVSFSPEMNPHSWRTEKEKLYNDPFMEEKYWSVCHQKQSFCQCLKASVESEIEHKLRILDLSDSTIEKWKEFIKYFFIKKIEFIPFGLEIIVNDQKNKIIPLSFFEKIETNLKNLFYKYSSKKIAFQAKFLEMKEFLQEHEQKISFYQEQFIFGQCDYFFKILGKGESPVFSKPSSMTSEEWQTFLNLSEFLQSHPNELRPNQSAFLAFFEKFHVFENAVKIAEEQGTLSIQERVNFDIYLKNYRAYQREKEKLLTQQSEFKDFEKELLQTLRAFKKDPLLNLFNHWENNFIFEVFDNYSDSEESLSKEASLWSEDGETVYSDCHENFCQECCGHQHNECRQYEIFEMAPLGKVLEEFESNLTQFLFFLSSGVMCDFKKNIFLEIQDLNKRFEKLRISESCSERCLDIYKDEVNSFHTKHLEKIIFDELFFFSEVDNARAFYKSTLKKFEEKYEVMQSCDNEMENILCEMACLLKKKRIFQYCEDILKSDIVRAEVYSFFTDLDLLFNDVSRALSEEEVLLKKIEKLFHFYCLDKKKIAVALTSIRDIFSEDDLEKSDLAQMEEAQFYETFVEYKNCLSVSKSLAVFDFVFEELTVKKNISKEDKDIYLIALTPLISVFFNKNKEEDEFAHSFEPLFWESANRKKFSVLSQSLCTLLKNTRPTARLREFFDGENLYRGESWIRQNRYVLLREEQNRINDTLLGKNILLHFIGDKWNHEGQGVGEISENRNLEFLICRDEQLIYIDLNGEELAELYRGGSFVKSDFRLSGSEDIEIVDLGVQRAKKEFLQNNYRKIEEALEERLIENQKDPAVEGALDRFRECERSFESESVRSFETQDDLEWSYNDLIVMGGKVLLWFLGVAMLTLFFMALGFCIAVSSRDLFLFNMVLRFSVVLGLFMGSLSFVLDFYLKKFSKKPFRFIENLAYSYDIDKKRVALRFLFAALMLSVCFTLVVLISTMAISGLGNPLSSFDFDQNHYGIAESIILKPLICVTALSGIVGIVLITIATVSYTVQSKKTLENDFQDHIFENEKNFDAQIKVLGEEVVKREWGEESERLRRDINVFHYYLKMATDLNEKEIDRIMTHLSQNDLLALFSTEEDRKFLKARLLQYLDDSQSLERTVFEDAERRHFCIDKFFNSVDMAEKFKSITIESIRDHDEISMRDLDKNLKLGLNIQTLKESGFPEGIYVIQDILKNYDQIETKLDRMQRVLNREDCSLHDHSKEALKRSRSYSSGDISECHQQEWRDLLSSTSDKKKKHLRSKRPSISYSTYLLKTSL